MASRSKSILSTATFSAISAAVAVKATRKWLKHAAKHPQNDLLRSDTIDFLQHVQSFLEGQVGEAVAKETTDNLVRVLLKLGFKVYLGAVEEDEIGLLEVLCRQEQEVFERFLEFCGDGGEERLESLMAAMKELEAGVVAYFTPRFSAKTLGRLRQCLGVLNSADLFRALREDEERREYFEKRVSLSRQINTRNLEFLAGLRRTGSLREQSDRIRQEQFEKMAKRFDQPAPARPGSAELNEMDFQILSALHEFILTESGDAEKANHLTTTFLKLNHKFSAFIDLNPGQLTPEQTLTFLHLAMDLSKFLETFIKVARDEAALPALLEQYRPLEDAICESIKPFFGQKTLQKVRSIFYYFSRDTVNVFFFSSYEMKERFLGPLEELTGQLAAQSGAGISGEPCG